MSEIIEEIHARLCEKLDEILAICAEYGYEVEPTLLLRHARGPKLSIILGNDDLNKAVLCIAELGNIGEVVEEAEPTEEGA